MNTHEKNLGPFLFFDVNLWYIKLQFMNSVVVVLKSCMMIVTYFWCLHILYIAFTAVILEDNVVMHTPISVFTFVISCCSRREKTWWGWRESWMDWRLGHSHLSYSCGDCNSLQWLYQGTAIPRVTEQNWRRAQVLCDSSRRGETDISWWYCCRGYMSSKCFFHLSQITSISLK